MTDRRTIHQKRVSFAGEGASLVLSDDTLGVQAFETAGKDGCVYGMGFSGMRCKPDYHYRFKSAEASTAHRDKWAADKRASAAAKKERSTERRAALADAGKSLAVGDVLVASWGYEQTNYDYYQVTRVFGRQSVEIRKLARQTLEDSAQAMTGECVPVKGRFAGEPMVKRVNEHVFGRNKRFICIDGLDLYDALDRALPLNHVIASKVRRAAETGNVIVRVRDLFP